MTNKRKVKREKKVRIHFCPFKKNFDFEKIIFWLDSSHLQRYLIHWIIWWYQFSRFFFFFFLQSLFHQSFEKIKKAFLQTNHKSNHWLHHQIWNESLWFAFLQTFPFPQKSWKSHHTSKKKGKFKKSKIRLKMMNAINWILK